VSPGTVRRLFATLRSVHTLRLLWCEDIDMLLPLVIAIPHLRSLHVTDSLPDAMIATLCGAMPQLQIDSGIQSYKWFDP
jgi:hypothetical protein